MFVTWISAPPPCAQCAGADGEEQKGLPRHVVGRPALELVDPRVGEGAAAPHDARPHAGDRNRVDERVEAAEGVGGLGEGALELVRVEHVGADRVRPTGADGVERVVALRDGGARPALRERVVEDRAAEVACAEGHERGHRRPPGVGRVPCHSRTRISVLLQVPRRSSGKARGASPRSCAPSSARFAGTPMSSASSTP